MNPPPRHRQRHLIALLGALGVLLVLALLAADWNWARPAVVRYLEHKSRREVRLDDLQIRLDADWQPVVRLRGLRVANAPWASGERPFIVAREASFTFDWATLFADVRVVRKMHFIEADIDLQRQPDGLRNWRLTRPDDRGGARMRVRRVQAERSRLTLQHRGLGLTLEARSTPLVQPRDGLTQQIAFQLGYAGAEAMGMADAGPVLSMVDTGEAFPLRGEARSGDTTLAWQGRVADLMQLSAVEVQVQLRGRTLAQLQPFLSRTPQADWPSSKPYRFDGRLVREGASWAAHQARFTLGRSDLAGDLHYTPAAANRGSRASLQATLHSALLRAEDLPTRGGAAPSGPQTALPAAGMHVLPQHAVPLDALRSLDGRIAWTVETLDVPKWPAARKLQATATLARGDLQLLLQQVDLAGGRWQGSFSIGTQARNADVALQLQARGVKLLELWPALSRQAQVQGVQWPVIDGQLKLTTLGATWASWWRGLNGQLELHGAGGSLPRKLDARLGLHAGRMLGALVGGDKPVAIRCGALSLAFAGGVGRTRSLVLETERTQLQGVGNVHLADESWALVLTPQPHGGALPASIVAQGTFRAAKVELAQREALPPASPSACSGS